jgi:O-antigen ligase
MILSRQNLDGWCGRAILGLLLAMLAFAPLAFGAVDEWALLVLQGMGSLLFLLWGARLWLNPKPKLLWPPLAWVVVAFTGYAVARYFTADIELVARAEVIQVVLFALVFLVILSNLHRQNDAHLISLALVALATLISGYAVVQLVTHSDRVWNLYSPYPGRAAGTYISPNDLAGLLGMLIPLALALLLASRAGMATRIFLGYAIIIMLAGLSATFSRAGWVATGVGMLGVLGMLSTHRNHRLWALLALLVLLAGGGLFVSKYLAKTSGFQQRVVSVDKPPSQVFDFETRFALWRAAGQMWLDHFWFGAGPAHFDYRFPEYRPAIIQERPNRAHNDYINLLADWGAIGGLLVLGGMGFFAVGWLKTLPQVRRPEADFSRSQSNRFAFFIGATGGLISLAVHSVADFNLHIPANALVGITLLALLVGQSRYATARDWLRAGPAARIILTGGLAAAVLALGLDGWRRGQETFWLARAEKLDGFSPERATLLEQAFAAEPNNFDTAYDIGESLRMRSFEGGDDFVPLAQAALGWYAKVIRLDPYYGYGYLRTGMCLDWLGKSGDSAKYYETAERLDPNGYFMVANLGWHYVHTQDYALAREYFIRSVSLSHEYASAFAENYLQICEAKLLENASGKSLAPF